MKKISSRKSTFIVQKIVQNNISRWVNNKIASWQKNMLEHFLNNLRLRDVPEIW